MANAHRANRMDRDSSRKWWKLPQHKKKLSKVETIWCKCIICNPPRGPYSRVKFKRGEDNVYEGAWT